MQSPRVPPEKRPSVISATLSPIGIPLSSDVSDSISRMPGPPRGPSLRTTTTSPALISPRIAASVAASSLSNTRAGPRKVISCCDTAPTLITAPSGASEPKSTQSAPRSECGLSSGRMQSGFVFSTPFSCSPSVMPLTIGASRSRMPGSLRQLGEDGGDATRRADVLHVPLPVAVVRRRDLRQVRRPLGHFIESRQRVVHLCFVGEGEDVEHRVRRAAHRDVERDRVVDRARGDDVAEGHALLMQLEEPSGRALRELVALGGGGEDGAVAGQREADRLAEAVHRVGGEHAAAGPAGRTRLPLELEEPLVGDLTRSALAHALEDGDQVERLAGAGVAPRFHRSAGDEDRRDVGARGAHEHAGDDLVAVRDADERVEAVGADHRLDRVGDDLAGGEGEVHPLVPHDDPVVHADRVELERDAARGADRVLDDFAERLEVDVPRDDVHVRVADGDERAVPLAVLHLTRRAEQAPVRRALNTALDRVRTHGVDGKGEKQNGPSS